MKSRFLLLAAVVSARTLEPSKNSEWKFKLDKYQAITGIDNDKKNEIWNITMNNSEFLTFEFCEIHFNCISSV